jgi:hypothetical protein
VRFSWPFDLSNGIDGGNAMLTANEITEQSWAHEVSSPAEIPAVYLPFFESLPIPTGTFPPAILTPTYAYRGFRRRVPEKLVTLAGNSVYVAENRASGLAITEHQIEQVNCVEVATMLLYSWITIHSVAEGGPVATKIEFNSVNMGLFQPLILAMRHNRPATAGGANPERDKFACLINQDFKFMNYARKSLLADEVVYTFIHQPEIAKLLFKAWGVILQRTIVPTHICILTDKELILIREELKRWWSVGPNYGGIWQYVPLSRISSMQVRPQGDELVALSITLQGGQEMETLFAAAHRDKLQHLIDLNAGKYSPPPMNTADLELAGL